MVGRSKAFGEREHMYPQVAQRGSGRGWRGGNLGELRPPDKFKFLATTVDVRRHYWKCYPRYFRASVETPLKIFSSFLFGGVEIETSWVNLAPLLRQMRRLISEPRPGSHR